MADAIWSLLSFLFPQDQLWGKLRGTGTSLVSSLLGTICSALKEEMSLVNDLDDELDKLKRTKVRINAKLKDADERRRIVDEHVKLWLRELDGFALDAEDLLDLVRTRIEAVRQKQQNTDAAPPQEESSRKRKRRSWTDIFHSSVYGYSSSVPLWLFQRSVAKEVVKVNQKFRDICDNRRDLQERRGDGSRRIDPDAADRQVPRGSLSDPEFVGMENDRKALLELLGASDAADAVESRENSIVLAQKSHNLCVIVIKGMGGSGKTTLVQSVYGDRKVEGLFQTRIWIYVKREYGPERITREMLESLGEKSNFINFNTLQRQLMNAVSGKKILLVLDNVDEPFLSCWDSVRPSLRSVANGSRVVVTTRSAKVRVDMSATVPQLEGLSEVEWLAMFKAKVGNLQGKPVLEEKAKRIAGKCQMSPLAAKVLGTLMANSHNPSSKDTDADADAIAEEWESVLDEMLTERESNLLQKTLAISYEQLPLYLKRCFAFCGIFPEGHDLDKDELAKCWTALGLMGDAKRPEAAGRRGFEDLVRLSFIERQAGTSKATDCFRMPGLMHELARSVSKHQCVTVEKQDPVIQPSTSDATTVGLRHALLHCAGMETEHEVERFLLKATQNHADRLRTFIVLHGESKVPLNRLPPGLFQRMRCLRVLDLSCTAISQVPDWVGELPLLRYLNLSNTPVSKLPDAVTSLINLQTLNLNDCYSLHELPLETCWRLTNLRHLLLRQSQPERSELKSTPPEIGRLTGLRSLSRFIVGERTTGYGIDQLRNLRNIKGDLWISCLENVADAEDAAAANLANKVEIQTLTLQWTSPWESSSDVNRDSQQDSTAAASSAIEPNPPTGRLSDHDIAVATDVIGALVPQPTLRNLSIDNYYGRTAPVWISQLQNLETLRLSHCQLLESLDVLEGLPQLKHLHLEGLRKLVAMKTRDSSSDKFRALQTLTLKNLPSSEVWFFHEGQMPNLMDTCLKLRVPRLLIPPSVTVEIDGCSLP